MTCSALSILPLRHELTVDVIQALSLEAVVSLGSLETLLDHLERSAREVQP